MAAQLYEFTKNHWIVYLEQVKFMVSKAYFNICLLKKKKTMPKEIIGYSLEL